MAPSVPSIRDGGGPDQLRVSRMLVDVNDQVQAGQPLLEISGKEQFAAVTGAQARLARAQAQQVEAERQLARFQALIAKG